MRGSYLGPEFSDSRSSAGASTRTTRVATHYDDFAELAADVAARAGRRQGRSAGSRGAWSSARARSAAAASSATPRNPEMQKKMNLKIKYREGFRPFAPSVLEEDVAEYFELDRPSPYMLLVAPVREDRQQPLPAGYADRPLYDRLYFLRSDLPAITHVDYSARIQTVSRATNPRYWTLINAFKALTGYGVIVNTSFNVRGEPIVCTPDDAYRCFMRTEMDFLVMGDYVLGEERSASLRRQGLEAGE